MSNQMDAPRYSVARESYEFLYVSNPETKRLLTPADAMRWPKRRCSTTTTAKSRLPIRGR